MDSLLPFSSQVGMLFKHFSVIPSHPTTIRCCLLGCVKEKGEAPVAQHLISCAGIEWLSLGHFSISARHDSRAAGTAESASPLLGPPVVAFFPFLGEGSPTKIDYRKNGTLILTSLLEDSSLVLFAICLDGVCAFAGVFSSSATSRLHKFHVRFLRLWCKSVRGRA